jgi:hypothetical protein
VPNYIKTLHIGGSLFFDKAIFNILLTQTHQNAKVNIIP